MSCELSVLLNGVQSVHATTIYVSNSYICLESVTCWWRYLVRYGRLEVSFLYGQCYLFLPYLCILFSVVQLRIVQSNQLRTSTWCWSWDQHVAILSSAKWFSFVLSMIRWLWQGVGMVMHRYAYECLEELVLGYDDFWWRSQLCRVFRAEVLQRGGLVRKSCSW